MNRSPTERPRRCEVCDDIATYVERRLEPVSRRVFTGPASKLKAHTEIRETQIPHYYCEGCHGPEND